MASVTNQSSSPKERSQVVQWWFVGLPGTDYDENEAFLKALGLRTYTFPNKTLEDAMNHLYDTRQLERLPKDELRPVNHWEVQRIHRIRPRAESLVQVSDSESDYLREEFCYTSLVDPKRPLDSTEIARRLCVRSYTCLEDMHRELLQWILFWTLKGQYHEIKWEEVDDEALIRLSIMGYMLQSPNLGVDHSYRTDQALFFIPVLINPLLTRILNRSGLFDKQSLLSLLVDSVVAMDTPLGRYFSGVTVKGLQMLDVQIHLDRHLIDVCLTNFRKLWSELSAEHKRATTRYLEGGVFIGTIESWFTFPANFKVAINSERFHQFKLIYDMVQVTNAKLPKGFQVFDTEEYYELAYTLTERDGSKTNQIFWAVHPKVVPKSNTPSTSPNKTSAK